MYKIQSCQNIMEISGVEALSNPKEGFQLRNPLFGKLHPANKKTSDLLMSCESLRNTILLTPRSYSHILYVAKNVASSSIEIGLEKVDEAIREQIFNIIRNLNRRSSKIYKKHYAFHENHFTDVSNVKRTNIDDFFKYHPNGLIYFQGKRCVHYHFFVKSVGYKGNDDVFNKKINEKMLLSFLSLLSMTNYQGKPLFSFNKRESFFIQSQLDFKVESQSNEYDRMSDEHKNADKDCKVLLNFERTPTEIAQYISRLNSRIVNYFALKKAPPSISDLLNVFFLLKKNEIMILGLTYESFMEKTKKTLRHDKTNIKQ